MRLLDLSSDRKLYTAYPVRLPQVCRQLRAEALSLPFSSNEFSGNARWIASALEQYILPHPHVTAYRDVCIVLSDNDTMWGSVHQRFGQKLLDVLQLLRQLEGLKHLLIQCCSGWPKKVIRALRGRAGRNGEARVGGWDAGQGGQT